MEYIVKPENVEERLDELIAIVYKDLSRSNIQKMIEKGNIQVNNKIQKASYKVCINDVITIERMTPEELQIKPQHMDLDILYEDDDLIAINKPKGLVVHPGNGNWEGTLVNAIMEKCKDSLSGIGGKIRPGIVHRLDKDTSGVIIIAKNDKAHLNISNQIKNRKVTKQYIALVRGKIKENEATIDMPIGRSKTDRIKMAVTREGKEAITHFKVMNRYDDYTLLQIKIDTGRTHQIRVHLAEINHPVIGDMIYSNGKNPFGVVGQMLHARSITFTHPSTGKTIFLEAPVPVYFAEVLKRLEEK